MACKVLVDAERYVSTILGERRGTWLPPSFLPSLQLTSPKSLTSLCLPKPQVHRPHPAAQTLVYCSRLGHISYQVLRGANPALLLFSLLFLSHSVHIGHTPTLHQDREPYVVLFLQSVHSAHPTFIPIQCSFF